MFQRRFLRALPCLVFLVTVPACQALHRYRPVVVQVRDVETKQPVPGAQVRLWYPMAESPFAPWEASDTTAADGMARLAAAPYGDAGVVVSVNAKGYLSGELNLSGRDIEAVEPAGLFENAGQRTAQFFVELYAEPGPSIELVLPTGYRGLVRVEVQIDENATCPPGKRVFSQDVPGSGVVTLVGPPLLRRVLTPDYHARYADGTVLTRKPANGDGGFWWVRDQGRYHCFLVGPESDYNIYRGSERAAELGLDKAPGSRKERGHLGRNRGGDDNPP